MQAPHDDTTPGVAHPGPAPTPPTAPVAPTAPDAMHDDVVTPDAVIVAPAPPSGGAAAPTAPQDYSHLPPPPSGGSHLPPPPGGESHLSPPPGGEPAPDYSHLPPPPAVLPPQFAHPPASAPQSDVFAPTGASAVVDARPQNLPPMFAPVPQVGAPGALPPGFGAAPGAPGFGAAPGAPGFGAAPGAAPRIDDPGVITNIVAQDGSVVDQVLYDEPSAVTRTTANALSALAFVVAAVGMVALIGFGLSRGIEEAAARGWLGFVGNNAAAERPFAPTDLAAVEAILPADLPGFRREPIPLPIPWVAPVLPVNASWQLTNDFGATATVTVGTTGGDENGEPIARKLTGVVPGTGPGWTGFGYESVDGIQVARAQRKEAPVDQAKGVFDTIYAYSPYKGTALVVQCNTDEVCRDVIRLTIEETRKRRLAAAAATPPPPPPAPTP